MLNRTLLILSAMACAGFPATAADSPDGTPQESTEPDSLGEGRSETGGQTYGDRNRGGPYGFYSYPRRRHVDAGGLDRRPLASRSGDPSHSYDGNYGSAYYGRDYGAPYFGGGYYDGGTYYRERRDR